MNVFVLDPIGEKDPEEIKREKRREVMVNRFYPLYREIRFSQLPVGMEFRFQGKEYLKVNDIDFELCYFRVDRQLNSSEMMDLSRVSRGSFPEDQLVFLKDDNFQTLDI